MAPEGTPNPKPVVVIVPGAHATPPFYTPFAEQLRSLDIETYVIPHPTAGRLPGPAPSLYDAGAFIASHLTQLVAEGRNIILAGHSYGGLVISSAALPHLHASARAARGLPGGIVKLVYIAALVGRKGESLLGLLGDSDYEEARKRGDEYMVLGDGVFEACFNDVNPQDPKMMEEARVAAGTFVEQSTRAHADGLQNLGYEGIDAVYIAAEKDLIVSPELQKGLIERLKEKAKSVEVYTFDAGHCPTVSKRVELAEVFRQLVESVKA